MQFRERESGRVRVVWRGEERLREGERKDCRMGEARTGTGLIWDEEKRKVKSGKSKMAVPRTLIVSGTAPLVSSKSTHAS
jgi:hypothetical protein